jgi:hypothetical protein
MPAARTAAASLMVWMMLCSQAGAPQQSDPRTGSSEAELALRAGSSTALIPLAHLSRASSMSAFAPWRSRIKSVLEETNPNVVDQFDLGPAALPQERPRCRSIELIDHRPLGALPLRC